MTDINYMDIAEFREGGYLQEVNRMLLHPLGLALSVTVDEDGTGRLANVWDYRDDPEGIVFAADTDLAPKAALVDDEWSRREPERTRRLGWMIQPSVASPSDPTRGPGRDPITSTNPPSGSYGPHRKKVATRISHFTVPPGTPFDTPEGLVAEDEECRVAFDSQGGVYPIRESVYRASYEPCD